MMLPTSRAHLKHQCPICEKKFSDRRALANHTGTKKQSSAAAHKCPFCKQRFCSEEAVTKHQNEPSHNTMFKCDKCDKRFKSTQALNSHERDARHLAIRVPMVFVRAGWSPSSRIERMVDTQLDGEDWSFCDGDCDWCGRCTESFMYGI